MNVNSAIGILGLEALMYMGAGPQASGKKDPLSVASAF